MKRNSKVEGKLHAQLVIKKVPWLKGEMVVFVGKAKRKFQVRLSMGSELGEPGRLILSEGGREVANVNTSAEPTDETSELTKWAYDVMLRLGSGAAYYYLRVNAKPGGTIGVIETVKVTPFLRKLCAA